MMDIRGGYLLVVITSMEMLIGGERRSYNWGTVTSGEYCDHEVFTAECKQGEMIVVQEAVYGHMRIGKCVEEDLGRLGCSADVFNVLDSRCTGKHKCEIRVDDRAFRDTQPCIKGLAIYLEAATLCVPEHADPCRPLTATSRESFIASSQMYNMNCQGSSSVNIQAVPGQHVVLSLITPDDRGQEAVGVVYGLAVGEQTEDEISIESDGAIETHLGTIKSSGVSIVLIPEYRRERFLIGYMADGCPDLSPPPTTVFRRHGDKATVSCLDTPQSWELTCRGVHWLGVIGNCSRKAAAVVMESKSIIEEESVELMLPKDAVFLIIGCATVFVSLVVITVGYVVLKRARIQQGAMTDKTPLSYTTVQRRSIMKQRPNSDYLTPTYPADGQEAQVYDFPLPEIPVTETLQTRGTVKRNNEEDYTASLSSTSTDYTRKYFVLDKDYIAVNNMHNC